MKQIVVYVTLMIICIFSYALFIYINSSSNDSCNIDDYNVNFRETLDFKGSLFVSNELSFTDNFLEAHNKTLISSNTNKIPWERVKEVIVYDSPIHGRAEISYLTESKEARMLKYYFSSKGIIDKLYYYFDLYNTGYKLSRKNSV